MNNGQKKTLGNYCFRIRHYIYRKLLHASISCTDKDERGRSCTQPRVNSRRENTSSAGHRSPHKPGFLFFLGPSCHSTLSFCIAKTPCHYPRIPRNAKFNCGVSVSIVNLLANCCIILAKAITTNSRLVISRDKA